MNDSVLGKRKADNIVDLAVNLAKPDDNYSGPKLYFDLENDIVLSPKTKTPMGTGNFMRSSNSYGIFNIEIDDEVPEKFKTLYEATINHMKDYDLTKTWGEQQLPNWRKVEPGQFIQFYKVYCFLRNNAPVINEEFKRIGPFFGMIYRKNRNGTYEACLVPRFDKLSHNDRRFGNGEPSNSSHKIYNFVASSSFDPATFTVYEAPEDIQKAYMDFFEIDIEYHPLHNVLYLMKAADKKSQQDEKDQREAGVPEKKIKKGSDTYAEFSGTGNVNLGEELRQYLGKEYDKYRRIGGGKRRKRRKTRRNKRKTTKRKSTSRRRYYY